MGDSSHIKNAFGTVYMYVPTNNPTMKRYDKLRTNSNNLVDYLVIFEARLEADLAPSPGATGRLYDEKKNKSRKPSHIVP
jgi:hypothetical protein